MWHKLSTLVELNRFVFSVFLLLGRLSYYDYRNQFALQFTHNRRDEIWICSFCQAYLGNRNSKQPLPILGLVSPSPFPTMATMITWDLNYPKTKTRDSRLFRAIPKILTRKGFTILQGCSSRIIRPNDRAEEKYKNFLCYSLTSFCTIAI